MTKILIVDDEESIRDLAQIILKDRGYEVITTGNGSKAIEEFQLEQPDLVLLDIRTLGMNGFDLHGSEESEFLERSSRGHVYGLQ